MIQRSARLSLAFDGSRHRFCSNCRTRHRDTRNHDDALHRHARHSTGRHSRFGRGMHCSVPPTGETCDSEPFAGGSGDHSFSGASNHASAVITPGGSAGTLWQLSGKARTVRSCASHQHLPALSVNRRRSWAVSNQPCEAREYRQIELSFTIRLCKKLAIINLLP